LFEGLSNHDIIAARTRSRPSHLTTLFRSLRDMPRLLVSAFSISLSTDTAVTSHQLDPLILTSLIHPH